MLKYLPLAIGFLAIGTLALAVGCADEPAEQPDPQLEGAQTCFEPAELSATAAEPSAVAPEPTPHLQSPEEAAAQDAALIAGSQGWTVEQAEAHIRASEALDVITSRLTAERPGILVGSALSPEPGGPPKIYIAGPADDFVRDLVTSAGIEIEIVEDQPYALNEIEERQQQVVSALQEWGFAGFSVYTDQESGQIIAAVVRQTGLPDDPDEILAGLPADLRENVTMTFSGGSPPNYDFGSLAVLEGGGGGADALGGTGCVRIDGECVTMVRETGEQLLLVWHASDVRWDGEEQEITYNVLGKSESLAIREGDVITVGGSSLVGDEAIERDLPWLAPPHASCTGEQWGVSGVQLN